MSEKIKQVRFENLEVFADELKKKYSKKTDLTAVSDRVTALEDVGAQANVLEGVKINGTALAIAEKMVDILFATGETNGTIKVNGTEISIAGLAAMAYKANVSQADLDTALAAAITAKANSADVYTKAEVDGKISSVYRPGGSVAFADLPTADAAHLGMVYNVTNKFTTTDAFLEGAGGKHPAGTNVVIAAVTDGETTGYKYDVLAGFVDLSGYVEKVDGQRLMTDEEGVKLTGIAEGATKVEASETNGNIKVNGAEQKVYELPSTVLHSTDFEVVTEAEVRALLDDSPAE